MSRQNRKVMVVFAIGKHLGMSEVSLFDTSESMDQSFRMAAWLNTVQLLHGGQLPSSLGVPPDSFRPEYYSFASLVRLDPTVPASGIPAPGIVIVLVEREDVKLPPEVVRLVAERAESLQTFIASDSYLPDVSSAVPSEAAAEGLGPKVFLSYSAADSAQAERLSRALEKAGIACFMAGKDLSPGDAWKDKIRLALREDREVYVLCSPNSIRSEWVLTEWGAAWVLGKRIVPVLHRVDVPQLPDRLRDVQAIDLVDFEDYVTAND